MNVALKVLTVFVVILLVAVLGFKLYDYIGAAEFYNNSRVIFATPGVADSNFVPQGMTYDEASQTFFFTGYMGKPIIGELGEDVAARVYFCDKNGDNLGFAKLLNSDGTPYTDHTGGIEVIGDYVYITGEDSHGLDVFLLSEILDGGTAVMQGTFKTYNSPAYVYAYEQDGQKYIMAGSYHKDEEIYETPDHERLETLNGDKNTSIMTVFKVDPNSENAEFGINPTPVAIISMREMVQGICITEDQLVISSSWGLATSNLYFYDLSNVSSKILETYTVQIVYGDLAEIKANPDNNWPKETLTFKNIPCYYIDSSCLVNTVVAPPMSEELVYLDGEIIVFCESACNKYVFGKLTTGFGTYALNYEKVK